MKTKNPRLGVKIDSPDEELSPEQLKQKRFLIWFNYYFNMYGHTVTELAKKIGYSRQGLTNMANGNQQFSLNPQQFRLFCKEFKTDQNTVADAFEGKILITEKTVK